MGYVRSIGEQAFMEVDCRFHSRTWIFRPLRVRDTNVQYFFQEELVRSVAFRYITDAITKEEALAMLKEKEAGKKKREVKVRELG